MRFGLLPIRLQAKADEFSDSGRVLLALGCGDLAHLTGFLRIHADVQDFVKRAALGLFFGCRGHNQHIC